MKSENYSNLLNIIISDNIENQTIELDNNNNNKNNKSKNSIFFFFVFGVFKHCKCYFVFHLICFYFSLYICIKFSFEEIFVLVRNF
jgi:hypothetical protein